MCNIKNAFGGMQIIKVESCYYHVNQTNFAPGPNGQNNMDMFLSSVLNGQKIDSLRTHVFHDMLSNIPAVNC